MIADVGGPATYHVGDEAMLAANIVRLRRDAPVDIVAVSGDPSATARAYGVEARHPIGFVDDRDRDRRLRLVQDAAARQRDGLPLDTEPAVSDAVRAMAGADALFISGGGNLSSSWPEHLYERVSWLQVAHTLGKPAVVMGQTLGPSLGGREWQLLAGALSTAQLVGVRELVSAGIALELGVVPDRLVYQMDDAAFLVGHAPDHPALQALGRPGRAPWIAVTIDPHVLARSATLVDRLGHALRTIQRRHDARLVFIPHVAGPAPVGDLAAAERLLGAPDDGGRVVMAPVLTAAETKWLTAQADLVISSRYHPLVFGLSAGVPCIGLWSDAYTRAKLEGALAHVGHEEWALPAVRASEDALGLCVDVVWANRARLAAELRAQHEVGAEAEHARWTRVRQVLTGAAQPEPRARTAGPWGPIRDEVAMRAVRTLARRTIDSDQAMDSSSGQEAHDAVQRLLHERTEAQRYIASLNEDRQLRQVLHEQALLYIASLEANRSVTEERLLEAGRYARSLEDERNRVGSTPS